MARSLLLMVIVALALLLLALGAWMPIHDLMDAGHFWSAALCWIALALPVVGPIVRRVVRKAAYFYRHHFPPADSLWRQPAPSTPIAPARTRSTVVLLCALRC